MGFLDSIKASLSGNIVLKSYIISDTFFNCGFNKCWNVYSAKSRQNGEDASVFILEKKKFSNLKSNDRTILFDILIHGLKALEDFKHSNILHVVAPVCDTKEIIAFASEPITSCLEEILLKDTEILEESEILINISQIMNALSYLHSTFSMACGALGAHNIVVTSSGMWKLTCLDFIFQFGRNDYIEKFRSYSASSEYMFTCMSPEAIKESQSTSQSDIFSISCLMIILMNQNDKEVFRNMTNSSSFQSFCTMIQNPSNSYFTKIPAKIRQEILSSVSLVPSMRSTISTILKNPIFNTLDIVLIRSLQAYPSMAANEKTEFIELFIKSINSASQKILEKNFLNFFISDLITPSRTVGSLKAILAISKYVSNEIFNSKIFPKILVLLDDNDFDIKLLLLQNFRIFIDRIDRANIQSKMINLLKSGLTSSNLDVKTSALNALKDCLTNEDINSMSSYLYPALYDCLIKADTLNVQVNSIMILSELMKYMKNSIDVNTLLSNLCSLQSNEVAFVMVILGAITNTYKFFKKLIDRKLLASSVIPVLLRNTQNKLLNIDQVDMYFKVIRKLLDHVEKQTKHPTKLESNDNVLESLKETLKDDKIKNSKSTPSSDFTKPQEPQTLDPLQFLREFNSKPSNSVPVIAAAKNSGLLDHNNDFDFNIDQQKTTYVPPVTLPNKSCLSFPQKSPTNLGLNFDNLGKNDVSQDWGDFTTSTYTAPTITSNVTIPKPIKITSPVAQKSTSKYDAFAEFSTNITPMNLPEVNQQSYGTSSINKPANYDYFCQSATVNPVSQTNSQVTNTAIPFNAPKPFDPFQTTNTSSNLFNFGFQTSDIKATNTTKPLENNDFDFFMK